MLLRTLLIAGAFLGFARPSVAEGNLLAPSCWEAFAPRPANAPMSDSTREEGDVRLSLASGGKPFVYGGWRCRVEGIAAGSHYRLRVEAIPTGIESVRESLTVLLRWRGDFGPEVAPSYVLDVRPRPLGTDAAQRGVAPHAILFERSVQAPPKVTGVDVELVLQWSRAGHVTWRRASLTASSPPARRTARVAAVWLRAKGARSGAEAAGHAAAFADDVAARHKPDVVLLGEAINHAGASGSLDDHAEAVPGPTTDRFAALARKHSTYVAFSLIERSGSDIFNTGVLLDRRGAIVGTYRKVQLPLEEVSAGEAPGDGFPVFDADFGKVGLMICHDTSFPEPARELSLGGAELILVPIWGGRAPLVRARAIENGVYVATAGYDYDSEIVDPTGRVLASAPHDKGPAAAVAEIDFNTTFPEEWIGNWRDTVGKQRRQNPYTRK